MEIISLPYRELDGGYRSQLSANAQAEFGGFPIVQETVWSAPDWSCLGVTDGQLACFYNLVLRAARFDGEPVPVAGVNNLVTLPTFRRRGLASLLLQQTEPLWLQLNARCGLLLCADALLPFYERLGWQQVHATVRFAQPGGSQVWLANCMLRVPEGAAVLEPREIDLSGLPW